MAVAESDGTVIGVNGYSNGIDEFSSGGNANVVVRDNAYGHTLDFSNTALTGIAEVDAGGGNDTVRTALSANTSGAPVYNGGTGTDTLQITLTLAQAQNAAIQAQIAAFESGLPSPQSPTAPFNFSTLGFSAVNFENVDTVVQIGSFEAVYDNVIIGTNGPDTITPAFVSAGVTGNPPPTNARDLILGNNYNDTIEGGGGNDIIIGAHGDDSLNGNAGNDFYVYTGTNNGYDSFTNNALVDGTDTLVVAADNTTVGLASGFVDGVDIIDGGNHANVTVRGTDNPDTLDFSNVTFQNLGSGFEVYAGNYNDEVTTSDITAVSYRGGHGDDTFHIGAANAVFLYDGTNNGYDTFTGNAGQTTTIQVGSDGTTVGLASGFANGVDTIDGGGLANVIVAGHRRQRHARLLERRVQQPWRRLRGLCRQLQRRGDNLGHHRGQLSRRPRRRHLPYRRRQCGVPL